MFRLHLYLILKSDWSGAWLLLPIVTRTVNSIVSAGYSRKIVLIIIIIIIIIIIKFKGGRVMIAVFVNYSTVAFPLHLPTLKRQQFFGAVANFAGKNSYFPLP